MNDTETAAREGRCFFAFYAAGIVGCANVDAAFVMERMDCRNGVHYKLSEKYIKNIQLSHN